MAINLWFSVEARGREREPGLKDSGTPALRPALPAAVEAPIYLFDIQRVFMDELARPFHPGPEAPSAEHRRARIDVGLSVAPEARGLSVAPEARRLSVAPEARRLGLTPGEASASVSPRAGVLVSSGGRVARSVRRDRRTLGGVVILLVRA